MFWEVREGGRCLCPSLPSQQREVERYSELGPCPILWTLSPLRVNGVASRFPGNVIRLPVAASPPAKVTSPSDRPTVIPDTPLAGGGEAAELTESTSWTEDASGSVPGGRTLTPPPWVCPLTPPPRKHQEGRRRGLGAMDPTYGGEGGQRSRWTGLGVEGCRDEDTVKTICSWAQTPQIR